MSENGATPPTEPEETPKLRLGGMALRNGLLIHGPTHWAAAARAKSGEIETASGPKPVLAPNLTAKIPLLRGPLRLAEAFMVIPLVRVKLPSARLPFEDPRVLATMAAASLAGRAIRDGRTTAPRELAQGILGLAPAMVALGNRDLAAYHGAEHKAIGAYEDGSDPAAATKEHERCGSNLVAPMLLMSAAGQLILEKTIAEPTPLARSAVGLASASLAVEMFAWSDRNPDTLGARAFHRPGHEIQRLIATKEPTPEQLEVAVSAMDEILRVEAESSAGSAAPQGPGIA